MHCTTQKMTIGELWIDQGKVDVDPKYQRETGVWSKEKKQLFIDSLINAYDIPKLYLHDIRTQKKPISFAVIDGKQRLTTIWDFIEGKFTLAEDFIYRGHDDEPPKNLDSFDQFNGSWQERFKSRTIDVVLVQDAEEDDIEELFSRLNNGESLNAAEKRNAIGGDMSSLIREIAGHRFFKRTIGFPNKRYSHYEVVAKLIRIELSEELGAGRFSDLKKKHLDHLVSENKNLADGKKQKIHKEISKNLDSLAKLFDENDPLLGKQSYPQMAYIFSKGILKDYAHKGLNKKLKEFFPKFYTARMENNQKNDSDKDPSLIEYGRLSQQGTNDSGSMESRDEIMRRYFLKWNDDVVLKDTKRQFTSEERYVIWVRGNKRCDQCGIVLNFEDFDADHVERWTDGGSTKLSNARPLCRNCNRGGVA